MHIFEGLRKFSPPRRHPRPRVLSDYLGGGLDGGDRVALEAHVRDCARCRRALDSLATTIRSLGSLGERSPTGVADSIIAALRSESPAEIGDPARSPGPLGPTSPDYRARVCRAKGRRPRIASPRRRSRCAAVLPPARAATSHAAHRAAGGGYLAWSTRGHACRRPRRSEDVRDVRDVRDELPRTVRGAQRGRPDRAARPRR